MVPSIWLISHQSTPLKLLLKPSVEFPIYQVPYNLKKKKYCCSELYGASQTCTELHTAVRSFTELHGASKSCTELHGASQSCTELHGASWSYVFLNASDSAVCDTLFMKSSPQRFNQAKQMTCLSHLRAQQSTQGFRRRWWMDLLNQVLYINWIV